MPYQPWNPELEAELIRLAVRACKLGGGGEDVTVGIWEIANSLNNRPCITRVDPGPNHGLIAFTIYPGHKKIVNRRACLRVLRALRNHPPLVLEDLANL